VRVFTIDLLKENVSHAEGKKRLYQKGTETRRVYHLCGEGKNVPGRKRQ
jgi:hypothetical protein